MFSTVLKTIGALCIAAFAVISPSCKAQSVGVITPDAVIPYAVEEQLKPISEAYKHAVAGKPDITIEIDGKFERSNDAPDVKAPEERKPTLWERTKMFGIKAGGVIKDTAVKGKEKAGDLKAWVHKVTDPDKPTAEDYLKQELRIKELEAEKYQSKVDEANAREVNLLFRVCSENPKLEVCGDAD